MYVISFDHGCHGLLTLSYHLYQLQIQFSLHWLQKLLITRMLLIPTNFHTIVASCTSDSDCPTWYFCDNATKQCKCGKTYHGMMKCNNLKENGAAYILNCYCVTQYNEESNSSQAGLCFYNCDSDHQMTMNDKVYHLLPMMNPAKDLNSAMCGRFNGTGVLCGKCNEGLYPFVLSYNFTCVECPDGHKNQWKFIPVGFVSLTFFYINITSSHLRGVVLLDYSQVFSVPQMARIIVLTIEYQHKVLKAMKAVYPFYTFWNLDFFHSIIPDICLKVSTMEALALDYAVAVYPIILIIISYVLIELYDHNILCVVYLWKPFYWILSFFRRKELEHPYISHRFVRNLFPSHLF